MHHHTRGSLTLTAKGLGYPRIALALAISAMLLTNLTSASGASYRSFYFWYFRLREYSTEHSFYHRLRIIKLWLYHLDNPSTAVHSRLYQKYIFLFSSTEEPFLHIFLYPAQTISFLQDWTFLCFACVRVTLRSWDVWWHVGIGHVG